MGATTTERRAELEGKLALQQRNWNDKYYLMQKRYEYFEDIDSKELKALLDIGDKISELERQLERLTPKSQRPQNQSIFKSLISCR